MGYFTIPGFTDLGQQVSAREFGAAGGGFRVYGDFTVQRASVAYNPMDYGAVGDGVHDDTDAMGRLFTSLNRHDAAYPYQAYRIYLPGEQQFRVTRGFTLYAGAVLLYGDGPQSRIILEGSAPYDFLTGTSLNYLAFKDFWLDGRALPAVPSPDGGIANGVGGRGIVLTGCSHVLIDGVVGYSLPRSIVRGDGCSDVTLNRGRAYFANAQGDPSVNNGHNPFWFTEQDGMDVTDFVAEDCLNANGHRLRISARTSTSALRPAKKINLRGMRFTRCGLYTDPVNGGGGCFAVVHTTNGAEPNHVRQVNVDGVHYDTCTDSHGWIQADEANISNITSVDSTFGGPLELAGARMNVDQVTADSLGGHLIWWHTSMSQADCYLDGDGFTATNVHVKNAGDAVIFLDNDESESFSTTLAQATSHGWPVLSLTATGTASGSTVKHPRISVGNSVTLGAGATTYLVTAVNDTDRTITVSGSDPAVAIGGAVVRRGARMRDIHLAHITVDNARGPAVKISDPTGPIHIDDVIARNTMQADLPRLLGTTLTADSSHLSSQIQVSSIVGLKVRDYMYMGLTLANFTTTVNHAAGYPVGTLTLTVADGTKVVPHGLYWIGSAAFGSDAEEVLIASVAGNDITLLSPTTKAHFDTDTVIRNIQYAINSIDDSTHVTLIYRWGADPAPVGFVPSGTSFTNPFTPGHGAIDITGDGVTDVGEVRITNVITLDDQATVTTKDGVYLDSIVASHGVYVDARIGPVSNVPIEAFSTPGLILGPDSRAAAYGTGKIALEAHLTAMNSYLNLRDVGYDALTAPSTTTTGVGVGEHILRIAGTLTDWASLDSLTISGESGLAISGAPVNNGDGTYTVVLSGNLVADHLNGVAVTNSTHATNAGTISGLAAGSKIFTVVNGTKLTLNQGCWLGTPAAAGCDSSGVSALSGNRITLVSALLSAHANGETVRLAALPAEFRIWSSIWDGISQGQYLRGRHDPSSDAFKLEIVTTGGQIPLTGNGLTITVPGALRFNVGSVNIAQFPAAGTSFIPTPDGTIDLGGASNRWGNIYGTAIQAPLRTVSYSSSGAIAVQAGLAKLTRGTAGVYTLADPVADGILLIISAGTAAGHTVTNAGSGFNSGGGASDVGTFGGAIGDYLAVFSLGTKWWVLASRNVTLA